MKKHNCVISAVGKNSLHKKWIQGIETANFDMHLIVYDDLMEKFGDDTSFFCYMKGQKLKLVYQYMQQHPEYIDSYDYFFLPDDDIDMDAADINLLFLKMKEYDLKIAQPSLVMSYFTWPHTLNCHLTKIRYINFVEMMVPCFSREALKTVLFTFNENETGWGADVHWPILINARPHDMAVIDEVQIVHTRQIQSGREQNRNDLKTYFEKYNILPNVIKYDVCTANDSNIFVNDLKLYTMLSTEVEDWVYQVCNTLPQRIEKYSVSYFLLLSMTAWISNNKNYLDAGIWILRKTNRKEMHGEKKVVNTLMENALLYYLMRKDRKSSIFVVSALKLINNKNKLNVQIQDKKLLSSHCVNIEDIFSLFYLFKLTGDYKWQEKACEELKNTGPQLMTFSDVLMLARMLYKNQ